LPRLNKPVWLWWSDTGATEMGVDRCWQSFLCRFDIEHTFFACSSRRSGRPSLVFAAPKPPTGGHGW
jgi:hypothetical protein